MTKRSHADYEADASSSTEAKASKKLKLKVTDALSLLSEHSDELIACLQHLKHSKSLDARLGSLSKTLLPVWKALAKAGGHAEGMTHEEISGGTDTQQTPSQATDIAKNSATVTTLTKWTVSDIPRSLPPLPPVLDPILEQAALTHAGYSQSGLSYERLEWIGDAYLYLISSGFIWQTFQTLSEGKCAQLREVLVRNLTLGEYSRQYGLDKRARLPAEFNPEGREYGSSASKKDRTKVLGDIFEAYTAAIIISDPINGLSTASRWLKSLWSSTLTDEIQKAEKKRTLYPAALGLPALDPSAKAVASSGASSSDVLVQPPQSKKEVGPKVRLAAELCVRGVALHYEDVDTDKPKKDKLTGLPVLKVGVFLDGWGETHKLLGVGTAMGKKEAGQKAAQMALDNTSLLKPYVEKKRRFLAAQEAQKGLSDL